jgi:hypothetical protein
MKRYAIVRGARRRSEAETYLPENYRVIHEKLVPAGPIVGDRRMKPLFVIEGTDNAGWTLDDYVVPRYASGLIHCTEIDLSHPIMKEIAVAP